MAQISGELTVVLRRAFLRTLRDFDMAARVRALLRSRPRGRVLAVGKAAAAMLAGAWDASVERALLVVPFGTRVAWAGARVDVRYASHPDPSVSSVQAADAAVLFARKGLQLALLSGGASALLARPAPGLSLQRKTEIVQTLSNAGAPIRSINLVRRHLSTIKGGGLAREAPGPVTTVLLSDVLEGGAHDVGSGPTVMDPTTREDAESVLAAYGLDAPLVETLKLEEARSMGLESCFVATPQDLALAAVSVLEDEGFDVHLLPSTDDDVEELALAYAGLSRALLPGQALVRVAEPTVKVSARPAGAGGRSTHLAALAASQLENGVALLCGASDGVDGASEAAGAVVTAASLRGHNVKDALARFDSGRLHRQAGSLLETGGPTGLNLCDLHILARG